MSPLVLPTGSGTRQSTTDASTHQSTAGTSIHYSPPLSDLIPTPLPLILSSSSSRAENKVATSPSRRASPRSYRSRADPTASAFIPRAARKSPSRCSEAELEALLDRNTRIIENIEATHHLPAATLSRLRADVESLRARIDTLRNVREIGEGVHSTTLNECDQPLESMMAQLSTNGTSPLSASPVHGASSSLRRRMEAEEVRSGTLSAGTQLMSFAESASIQRSVFLTNQAEHSAAISRSAGLFGSGHPSDSKTAKEREEHEQDAADQAFEEMDETGMDFEEPDREWAA